MIYTGIIVFPVAEASANPFLFGSAFPLHITPIAPLAGGGVAGAGFVPAALAYVLPGSLAVVRASAGVRRAARAPSAPLAGGGIASAGHRAVTTARPSGGALAIIRLRLRFRVRRERLGRLN